MPEPREAKASHYIEERGRTGKTHQNISALILDSDERPDAVKKSQLGWVVERRGRLLLVEIRKYGIYPTVDGYLLGLCISVNGVVVKSS